MESTGKYWIPVFNVLEKNNIWVTLSHPKYTKPQKGNKTDCKDARWICDLYMCGMVKPSFIPPADIRELRDLVRYRFKLTCMITGEKNRAHNCLTVSNLKLDDVFSDIFGKSSRSITEQILQHPGETFDVAPFVDSRCKTPVEEIQAAVDGAISMGQAVKLRQCLDHIDELEKHQAEIEREIFRLSDKYERVLNLIRTVPGFDKNPPLPFRCSLKSEVICLSSPQRKTSYHGLDVVPATIKAIIRSNPPGFPVLVPILNQFWCRLQML